ncbi:hypothetical protein F442_13436 [Phytophthora nicotianae P10297]|uniref:RxLR effector protein n=2 Tax=Phytophthora nicotianae TaxID=4792 RepID=W2YWI4_PHYNI|nr:hypothetical protein F444_13633 [Phytophthora nicotianae P1976]ETP39081.1 hypothetical protein F442_13436 [Phytophthora nicotianae P10297]
MRFSNCFILLVAISIGCFTSHANAESGALTNSARNNARRLHIEAANADKVAQLTSGFIKKLKDNAALRKVTNIAKVNEDDAAIRNAAKAAAAKEGVKLSDESVSKVAKKLAEVTKTKPKLWSRLYDVTFIVWQLILGGLAGVGTAYLLRKHMNSTETAMPTSGSRE